VTVADGKKPAPKRPFPGAAKPFAKKGKANGYGKGK